MKRTYSMKNGFSPGKGLFQTGLALLATAVLAVPAAFGATALAPNAEYSQSRLAPDAALHGWVNVVPNALADYFTYVPYSTTDATALGFPATCGATGAGGEDCYTITVKAFNQQLAHPTIFGGGSGLKDETGAYFGPANPTPANQSYTYVYGYGSGGTGWIPPQFTWGAGNTIQKNLAPVTLTKGNAPTFFVNNQFDLNDKGIWHFPAPSIKGTKGRPIRIQWLNELPNLVIPGLDPTVDCSDSSPNCFPYNRIVTHVHGAHVGPASDGLTQAEYNPDFSHKGMKFSQSVLPPGEGPPGTYVYPMDQEAATIWYHDHAAGSTHLNTNMGMAGFFPVTDDNEKCLQGISHPTLCPTPTKVLPTGSADSGYTDSAYELGFALQDRVFYTNGQLAMPDAPVIDGNFPSCDPATAASRLATCSPLFMYARHAANADSKTPAGIHLIPYDEFAIDLTIPENNGVNGAPLLATSATLEFFGNMPVVNGVVYGKYDAEPRVYRMRFIGGTDSRTWDLQLEARNAAGAKLGVIPFWQIGSEQGFLNTPVSRTDMLLMPGERLDALVDFGAALTAFPTMTNVMMINLGTDGPYQGELLTPFNRSIDIPEIMKFTMVALNAGHTLPTTDVPAPSAGLALQRAGVPLAASPIAALSATLGTPVRNIALEEIVDEYQRIMPTIDRRGYDLPGMQATEIVKLNDTEEWDIINTTADAHPMHLHLVAFQVINRQPFTSFVPATNDIANGVFSQPQYTVDNVAGPALPPDPQDAGWKDTVYTPPGFVTRVIARFDKSGEYVWHCHILSHEEHDMMRPLKVVQYTMNPPASITVPASTPNDRTATVTIAAAATLTNDPANPTPTPKYYVEYKRAADSNWMTNLASGTSQVITFPADGTYSVRVKAVDSAISPAFSDSSYTNSASTVQVWPSDSLTPASGTLTGASQTFTFTTSGAYPHYLWLGTSAAGSSELGRYTAAAGVSQITATGLPINGSTVYARLWVKVGTGATATMRYRDYTFTAVNITGATISSPTPGVLTSDAQTFTWADIGASKYQLRIGSTPNGYEYKLVTVGAGTTSITVTGLPVNSAPLKVTLLSLVGTTWVSNAYNYTAAGPAAIATPSPGVLTSSSQTFTWNNVGAVKYQLRIGSTPGAYDYGIVTVGAGTTSATISGLPLNSAALKVTLMSQLGSTWASNSYDYTSAGPAAISSPAPGVLTSNSQTFTWNNAGASKYQLRIGSTPGAYDYGIVTVSAGTTSATISGLPVNSSPLKVTLMSLFGTTWVSTSYNYTSAGPAVLSTPTSGATLGTTQQFQWNNVGAANYQLRVGSALGTFEYGMITVGSTTTSTTLSGLPTGSIPLVVTLYSKLGTSWVPTSINVTSAP